MEGGEEVSESFFYNKRRRFCNELNYQKGKLRREERKEWERVVKDIKNSAAKDENRETEIQTPVNLPFILSCLRCIFSFLYLLSFSYWISGSRRKQKQIEQLDFKPYRCIDIYNAAWLLIEVLAAIVIGFCQLQVIAFVGVFSYRLFEIFQSWVSQFMLRGRWNAINVNRSIVLAFTGYIEITIIGAIVKFTYGQYKHTDVKNFLDALYDSVKAMIANPEEVASPIQYVQIMFAILFAAVVVQHVVGRLSQEKGDQDD